MKIWVKIRLNEETKVEKLIREFFRNFNSKSSIVIKDQEVKMELFFEKDPPTQLIDTIVEYDLMELNFGKVLEEYTEGSDAEVETPEKTEGSNAEVEIPEETKDSNPEVEIPEETKDSNPEVETPEETKDSNPEVETPEETKDSNPEVETPEETKDSTPEVETLDETKDSNPKVETLGKSTVDITDNSKQTKNDESKTGKSTTRKPRKVADLEMVNVPKLEEIAKNAESFEHFAKLVAEYLEINKRQDFFKELVFVATEVENVSWREVDKALKDKNVVHSQWDKISISQQVTEKLRDYSATLLPLLYTLRQYKNYSFGCAIESVTETVDELVTETVDNSVTEKVTETITESEDTTSKNRVKMECMPEIPVFEEVLGSVDKTQPIEERVKYVLSAMGWNESNKKMQKEIFEVTNVAVRVKEMSLDDIFLRAEIPEESSLEVRMELSQFINDFVGKYDSDKKVRLLDFLEQLQKVVINEGEI